MGSWGSCVEEDGWTARIIDHSICVQSEHTVAIIEERAQILTLL